MSAAGATCTVSSPVILRSFASSRSDTVADALGPVEEKARTAPKTDGRMLQGVVVVVAVRAVRAAVLSVLNERFMLM